MDVELLVSAPSCTSCPPLSVVSSAHEVNVGSKVMHHNMASSSWSSSGSNVGVKKSSS